MLCCITSLFSLKKIRDLCLQSCLPTVAFPLPPKWTLTWTLHSQPFCISGANIPPMSLVVRTEFISASCGRSYILPFHTRPSDFSRSAAFLVSHLHHGTFL